MTDPFLARHVGDLTDFWGRKRAETPHHLAYSAYGYPVTLTTNAPRRPGGRPPLRRAL